MEKKLSKLKGNLKMFQQEFIIAGPRTTTISLYNKLIELGASTTIDEKLKQRERLLASDKFAKVVVLCKNEGITGKFAYIQLLSRSWWDMYHNKQKIGNHPKFRTYNSAKQMDKILSLLKIEAIQILTPEDED